MKKIGEGRGRGSGSGRGKYHQLGEDKIRNPMQFYQQKQFHILDEEQEEQQMMESRILSIETESKQRIGTILSSFYNLANTILGSGMLGLPYAYSRAGWLLGSIFLILSASIASFSLHLLSVCALTQSMPSSFHKVGKSVFTSASVLIDIAVAIKCFGVATSYLIVIGDLMPSVFASNSVPLIWRDRRLWITLLFIVVTGLSFLRDLDSLKFTSLMSIVFVVLLTILIATYSMHIPLLDPCESVDPSEICRGNVSVASLSASTLSVFPIFIFSFTCHQVYSIHSCLIFLRIYLVL